MKPVIIPVNTMPDLVESAPIVVYQVLLRVEDIGNNIWWQFEEFPGT